MVINLNLTLPDSKIGALLALLAPEPQASPPEPLYDLSDPKCYLGLSPAVLDYLKYLATGPKSISELIAKFGKHYYTRNSAITRRVRLVSKDTLDVVGWDYAANKYYLTEAACINVAKHGISTIT